MRVRDLANRIGVPAGTVNVWIQRGYIDGLSVNVSGIRRELTRKQAATFSIIASLGRLGIAASEAAKLAEKAIAQGECSVIDGAVKITLFGDCALDQLGDA